MSEESRDIFFIVWNSANTPPGKGTNERLVSGDDYSSLRSRPDWRKTLSNYYASIFTVDGLKWNSVEHMYQGYKAGIQNDEKGFQFSMNSNSPLSKETGNKAHIEGGKIKLNKEEQEYWTQIEEAIMLKAMIAKFTTYDELKQILLNTKNAILIQGDGKRRESDGRLEFVREFLKSK